MSQETEGNYAYKFFMWCSMVLFVISIILSLLHKGDESGWADSKTFTMCWAAESETEQKIRATNNLQLMITYVRELNNCQKYYSGYNSYYECKMEVINRYNQLIDNPPRPEEKINWD